MEEASPAPAGMSGGEPLHTLDDDTAALSQWAMGTHPTQLEQFAQVDFCLLSDILTLFVNVLNPRGGGGGMCEEKGM